MIFAELSEAFFRFVLRCICAVVVGGRLDPPPPPGRPPKFWSTCSAGVDAEQCNERIFFIVEFRTIRRQGARKHLALQAGNLCIQNSSLWMQMLILSKVHYWYSFHLLHCNISKYTSVTNHFILFYSTALYELISNWADWSRISNATILNECRMISSAKQISTHHYSRDVNRTTGHVFSPYFAMLVTSMK